MEWVVYILQFTMTDNNLQLESGPILTENLFGGTTFQKMNGCKHVMQVRVYWDEMYVPKLFISMITKAA